MSCQLYFEVIASANFFANSKLSGIDGYMEDYLENKEVVYIAVNTDSKGLMLRNELVRRLGLKNADRSSSMK